MLQYPLVDDITQELRHLGPGTLLYQIDISRAFRHIYLGDIDLLGIHHKSVFLDGLLPFGFCHGPGLFERCSDAIMKTQGHNSLKNYIENLIYVGLPSKIHESYKNFCPYWLN